MLPKYHPLDALVSQLSKSANGRNCGLYTCHGLYTCYGLYIITMASILTLLWPLYLLYFGRARAYNEIVFDVLEIQRNLPDSIQAGLYTMPDAQCPMPNAQCPMPNAQCPMPDAKCPMPDAQCPMPSAQCPMPNACVSNPDMTPSS